MTLRRVLLAIAKVVGCLLAAYLLLLAWAAVAVIMQGHQ